MILDIVDSFIDYNITQCPTLRGGFQQVFNLGSLSGCSDDGLTCLKLSTQFLHISFVEKGSAADATDAPQP
jgi:hypothetical protein